MMGVRRRCVSVQRRVEEKNSGGAGWQRQPIYTESLILFVSLRLLKARAGTGAGWPNTVHLAVTREEVETRSS